MKLEVGDKVILVDMCPVLGTAEIKEVVTEDVDGEKEYFYSLKNLVVESGDVSLITKEEDGSLWVNSFELEKIE